MIKYFYCVIALVLIGCDTYYDSYTIKRRYGITCFCNGSINAVEQGDRILVSCNTTLIANTYKNASILFMEGNYTENVCN